MATGGISEREDRLRRRNIEKELKELIENRFKESEAPHERTFDEIFRSRISDFGERSEDRNVTDDNNRTQGIYPDRRDHSTPYMADRHIEDSVDNSLDQSERDRKKKERREMRGRKADPYRLGTPESEPVKRYDDFLNFSIDDSLDEFKKRIEELSASVLTIDQTNEDEDTLNVKEQEIEDRDFKKRQTLLTETENKLHEREMKVIERESEMIKREKYLTEMEQALSQKLDQIEKEHLKKEMTLHGIEQKITSYMEETKKKMNDRIDKMEMWYKRKDNELKEKEASIEKMKQETQGNVNHSSEKTDGKKSVRIETDTDTEDETDQKEEIDRRRERDNNSLDSLNLKLNLTPFSGMEPVPRNEATFEEWKLEVECVKAIFSELVVIQAIRKALKGQAKRIMLHLGPYASVEKIEKKLEDAFGNIASKDSILSHFFLAEQEVTESIVEWGLKLEDMLLQASRKTKIPEKEKEDMLKRKFWRGLRNEELQNATRVHFESEISYEQLRKQVRLEEFEMRVQKERKDKKDKPQPSKIKQSALNFQDEEGKQMMKLLIDKMEKLDQKVEELKKENEQVQKHKDTPQRDTEAYRYNRSRGYNRGRWNRRRGRGYEMQQGQSSKESDKKAEKTDSLNEKGSS